MKKNLMLAILPAIMILSSCSTLNRNVKAEPIFQEDTLAHEEIFGESTPLVLTAPKKASGDPEMIDRAQPAIGVQYQEANGNISIRFVAAIDVGDGDINDFKAVWKRTFYWSDGTVGKAEANKESLKAYTSLNNQGSVYSIDDFNNGVETYDYFVVYTMTNIPKETYQYCRLNAYLDLNNGTVYSKVVSTTVAGNYKIAFNHDAPNYFMAGKINGVENAVVAQHSPTLGNDNQASFIADIQNNDQFFVVHRTNNYFGVYGGSDLGNTTNFVANDGMIKSNASGNFAFYLGNDNHLYPSEALVTGGKGFYVRGDAAKGWDNFSLELSQVNWENLMVIENVALEANKEFKIGRNPWDSGREYNWNDLLDSSKDNFEQGSGTNIKVKTGGTYNIYITINQCLSIAKVGN